MCGMHTNTALIVNEMEERLILDLEKWLKELAPPLQGYKHDDLHLRDNIPEDEPKNAHSHMQALIAWQLRECAFPRWKVVTRSIPRCNPS